MRSATKLVGNRERGAVELEEASRAQGHLTREIETLTAALEEERQSRRRTTEAYDEHREATAAFVKGNRISEARLEEKMASQAVTSSTLLAHAQAVEQSAVWRVEEEAGVVESLENSAGFFESELEIREVRSEQSIMS
jgi:hypothetical protein